MSHKTILETLLHHVQQQPNATALLAPDRTPISYHRLYEQISTTIAALNKFGIGRQDRVAIVLPNGPDMVAAFLSITAIATSAPLNPDYRASEYDFYLSDLKAKALVVLEGTTSAAVEVAKKKNILIIRLIPQKEAGIFLLKSETTLPKQAPMSSDFAQIDDIVLVLHTSGTTSRPKLVSLTQKNLTTSVQNLRKSLQLSSLDRCLSVMPLFHIAGIMTDILGALTAGGSLVCTPGFYAPSFLGWLDRFAPNWYSVGPAMHQAILSRTAANQSIIGRINLRFIRSSSAWLPLQLRIRLEKAFGVPVIEAYGMTEASSLIACTPLPPLPHKLGTVGLAAAGPDVAIMDELGNFLPFNTVGEIVIRGENVIVAYENNPEANAAAFVNGWLRSGDQGKIDENGYVTITGRLKEVINRGGEKISPQEVDNVLLNHPDVLQAVTFAIPHPQLGEEIAAAVVLEPESKATPLAIRLFITKQLADFKVPRQIVILDKIPKGDTGKLQRIGLAEKLDITADVANLNAVKDWTPPKNDTQKFLVTLWMEVLGLEARNGRSAVGIHARFLDLGGDSVLATQFISRLRQSLGIELSMIELFDRATIAEQAEFLDTHILTEII